MMKDAATRQKRHEGRWRQSEAQRAIRAVEAMGLTVERLECAVDGTIAVYAAPRDGKPADLPAPETDWDRHLGIAKA